MQETVSVDSPISIVTRRTRLTCPSANRTLATRLGSARLRAFRRRRLRTYTTRNRKGSSESLRHPSRRHERRLCSRPRRITSHAAIVRFSVQFFVPMPIERHTTPIHKALNLRGSTNHATAHDNLFLIHSPLPEIPRNPTSRMRTPCGAVGSPEPSSRFSPGHAPQMVHSALSSTIWSKFKTRSRLTAASPPLAPSASERQVRWHWRTLPPISRHSEANRLRERERSILFHQTIPCGLVVVSFQN